ncbi:MULTISPECIES: lantibiotic dehydratase C-terminal domain-containing protein [unclassified Streptomyces]|uniref:lantibiotic dehydratase C-terminal domain-containing protein n=1 Tax=unclassified Streptomyces TaxID=2593676 RepID=UPI001CBE2490|nr:MULTISPECIES: lantibiotic dehydratase C-terminal domain-containing protein [unclassified Streptomyces]WPO69766.1 lantibiotic dehydratase C-terminal domain-containing protein [Streptomyces sp. KN37]
MTRSNGPVVWQDHRLYHRADPDGLLTELVAPVLRDAAPYCRAQHFFREWQGGPNIRVALLVDKEHADRVAQHLRARCLDHLARSPRAAQESTPHRAPPGDLDSREGVVDDLPPQPDNSLLAVEHRDRSAQLGGPAAVDLFDRFHDRSTGAALRTLVHWRTRTRDGHGSDRARAAVTLMLHSAMRFPGPLRLGAMSYRSHVEGAVMESPRPDQLRRELAQFAERWTPALHPLAEQLLTSRDAPTEEDLPGVRTFLDHVERLVPDVRALLAADELHLPLAGRNGETTWDEKLLRRSTFHHSLQRDPRWLAAAAQDPVLRLHRVLINWGYLHMTRLGVLPAQRLALCHLVAELVDRYAEERPYLTAGARDLAAGGPGALALRYIREHRTGSRIPQDVDWSLLPAERPDRDGRNLVPLTPQAARLGSVLQRTAGVSRLRWEAGARSGGGRFVGPVHRVIASAGQRYPAELHVLPGKSMPEVPTGRYEPAHHALAVPPVTEQPPTSAPQAELIVAVSPWRTRFKYGEFAYRLQCMDAGVLVGQALAVAEADQRPLRVRYWFSDAALDERIGVNGTRTRSYAALDPATNGIPHPDSGGAIRPTGDRVEDAARSHHSPPATVIPPLLPRLAAGVRSWTEVPSRPRRPDAWTARRTSMGLTAPGALDADEFGRLLQRVCAPYESDLPGGVPFSQTAFIAVIGEVDGVDAGVYLVADAGRRIGLLRAGDVRPALQYALDNGVFDVPHIPLVLTLLTDYEAALPHYGDRWLRIQGMEAGVAVQRCHLSAAADSLACQAHCGYDPDRLLAALDLDDQHLDPMIQLLVGRSRPPGLHHEIALF